MVQVLTPGGLHFPTHKGIRKTVIPLDNLLTRLVQSQEVLPTRLPLAQYGDKSGIASVLLALCSSSLLFLCLSVSLIPDILWLHFMSGVTPPLCLNASLVSLSPLFLFITPCSAFSAFSSFSLSCIVLSSLSNLLFL